MRHLRFIASILGIMALTAFVIIEKENAMERFDFILSDAQAQTRKQEPVRAIDGQPLTAEQTRILLDRIPDFEQDPETGEFVKRKDSRPLPPSAEIIDSQFPPEQNRDLNEVNESGPLKVLSMSPQGDVDLVPRFSVTFSQPMVALTSHDQLDQQNVPVKLEPQPEGTWRWLGTRTLVFDTKNRLPRATRYTLTAPKGLRSATGGELLEKVESVVTTPPIRLVDQVPRAKQNASSQPVVVLVFDQDIHPEVVFPFIKAYENKKPVAITLATQDRIKSDAKAFAHWDRTDSNRRLALSFEKPLSTSARIEIHIEKGAPSAEGPLLTEKRYETFFQVHGPLRVTRHQCGYQGTCNPADSWTFTFSNELDLSQFNSDEIKIKPILENLNIYAYGRNIQIVGQKKGEQKYTVTLPKNLRDIYGGKLEGKRAFDFKVGPYPQSLGFNRGDFSIADPYGPPVLDLYSVNHDRVRLKVRIVEPNDFQAFQNRQRRRGATYQNLPGELAEDRLMELSSKPESMTLTRIDLAPWLTKGLGNLIVTVEPEGGAKEREWNNHDIIWMQFSKIALDAFQDSKSLQARVTSLIDGAPIADVSISLTGDSTRHGSTDKDGLWVKSLKDIDIDRRLLVAQKGDDICFTPNIMRSRSISGSSHGAVHVFDDRGLYKPGEKVHIKGWLRKVGVEPEYYQTSIKSKWEARDARGSVYAKGETPVSSSGAFDFQLDIPDDVNLGHSNLKLNFIQSNQSLKLNASHSFLVQEFRRPDFEVSLNIDPGPYYIGDPIYAESSAAYYSGEPLSDTDVNWRVVSKRTTFVPPNWSRFEFGEWLPWWRTVNNDHTQIKSHKGITNGSGSHILKVEPESNSSGLAHNLQIEAGVSDVNHQRQNASSSILVHPAQVYVGLRSDRYFVPKGQSFSFEGVVADVDGGLVPNRTVDILISRQSNKMVNGSWRYSFEDHQEIQVKSEQKPFSFQFIPKTGGTWRIEATVTDEVGRISRTIVTRWVSGGFSAPPSRSITRESVTIIPDKKEYASGEEASFLVQSPFNPAHGVYQIISGDRILEKGAFSAEEGDHTIRVKLTPEMVPSFKLRVSLTGSGVRINNQGKQDASLPDRPAFAGGELTVEVPPKHKQLQATITPEKSETRPGNQTRLEVKVTGPDGQPITDADVVVYAVDEAILGLAGYQLRNPLNAFYPQRYGYISTFEYRQWIKLVDDTLLENLGAAMLEEESVQTMSADMAPSPERAMKSRAMPASAAPEPQPIAMRSNFSPLAVWLPNEKTDADGRISVDFKLPDSLTRYRLMAVAATESMFGTGESTLTARLPLNVRATPPRFLNFGDRFQLPVTIQNNTDQKQEVQVALKTANLKLDEPTGREVTIPPRERIRLLFSGQTISPGKAYARIALASKDFADASELVIPVWTPATSEAFAVYGEIDEGALQQPVAPPDDVFTQFGGMQITTSSTAMQALTDAVLYVVEYPFACSEQRSSRILAVATLQDMIAAFGGDLDPEQIQKAIKDDIRQLQLQQNPDGGFSFWRRDNKSWPYITIHVAHALQRAQKAGYEVPQPTMSRVMQYLSRIDDRIPNHYGEHARYSLTAYALWVENFSGKNVRNQADKAFGALPIDQAPLEALGWLLPIVSGNHGAQILTHLNNRATQTASTAQFATSYGEGDYLVLNSNRRTDGILLDALIEVESDHHLIPKLTRGLLAHRSKGRWLNTQENAFILLALHRYFKQYEAVEPDFTALAWLGQDFAGEASFKGRTTEQHRIQIPMAQLASMGSAPLTLKKEGPGRLYYRLGLDYAPKSLQLNAANHGFFLERIYEAVDHPDDVKRDENGVWHIKAGADVRVKITLAAPERRYHVALVDPLPAGLEPIGSLNEAPKHIQPMRYYRWWRWYEHENLRDERAEAFTSLLHPGVHEYTWLARATTSGTFIVPPTKAEEMYAPETFGRTATTKVVVYEP